MDELTERIAESLRLAFCPLAIKQPVNGDGSWKVRRPGDNGTEVAVCYNRRHGCAGVYFRDGANYRHLTIQPTDEGAVSTSYGNWPSSDLVRLGQAMAIAASQPG